jgi:hypothetical protein
LNTEAKINSLIGRFKETRRIASSILSTATSPSAYVLTTQTRGLLDSYEAGRKEFATVTKEPLLLRHVPSSSVGAQQVGLLQQLSVECATAAAYLETLSSPISTAEKDKLESLRREIASLEAFNGHLYTHVNAAINEYELAHYLASALLAGKSVVYALEQFPGKTSEEKASNLIRAKLLREDLKGQVLRAERKARDFFTHDIAAIPQPQEALALVAEACNLSMILMKLNPDMPSQSDGH